MSKIHSYHSIFAIKTNNYNILVDKWLKKNMEGFANLRSGERHSQIDYAAQN